MAFYSESSGYYNAMDPSFGKGQLSSMWANYYLGASTAMQPLEAVKSVLNLPQSGIENVELSIIDPAQFETVPKHMFDEIRRIGDMNIRSFVKEGRPSPLSVHAPVRGVNPEGFDAQNQRWAEEKREHDEALFKGVIDKAVQFGPNVVVTVHASAAEVPSQLSRYNPANGKKIEDGTEWLTAIDTETGQLLPYIKREVKEYPSGPKTWTPEKRLANQNAVFWGNQIKTLGSMGAELLRLEQLKNEPGANIAQLEATQDELHTEIRSGINDAFSKAITSLKIAKDISTFTSDQRAHYAAEYDGLKQLQQQLKSNPKAAPIALEYLNKLNKNIEAGKTLPPPVYLPYEEFARVKASDTFANLAIHSVQIAKANKMKPEQAPIISMENGNLPENAFGTGESMRQLVELSRNKFVEKARTELKMSESKAREIANKIIGTTWDIGHLNLIRKNLEAGGFNEKEVMKLIANETAAITKDIKHVHAHDNFGFNDVHLAPGMGNVPIKEVMKQLEKAGVKGVKSIIEAGGSVAEWKENPTLWNLRYFNTPVYGFQKAQTWGGETVGSYFMGSSGYSAGYGTFLPPVHFSEYGTGFTALPTALGAPLPGQRSAFSGTPMA